MDSTLQRNLIYIHGFGSSSASWKAQLLREYFARHGAEDRLFVPSLPVEPRRAMARLEETLAAAGPAALVGSSLGGFYATWLACHHELKAVLVNPVVRPWRLLADYTGDNLNQQTGETEYFDPDWVGQLESYGVDAPMCPENLLVLVQTGDDTLDWHDAADFYQDCHFFRGLGGSHGFDDFDAFIPLLLRFCGITLTKEPHD
jgi:predicted esterase YcpF (UPF0227 family)